MNVCPSKSKIRQNNQKPGEKTSGHKTKIWQLKVDSEARLPGEIPALAPVSWVVRKSFFQVTNGDNNSTCFKDFCVHLGTAIRTVLGT